MKIFWGAGNVILVLNLASMYNSISVSVPSHRLRGVTARTITRSWVRLPVGSLSSGYYLYGWLSVDRSTQPTIPPG